MGRMKNAVRTVKEQVQRVAEKHPKIALVPSEHDAAEQHHPSSSSGCGAIASFAGEFVECRLDALHADDRHDDGNGHTWRRRSGDDA